MEPTTSLAEFIMRGNTVMTFSNVIWTIDICGYKDIMPIFLVRASQGVGNFAAIWIAVMSINSWILILLQRGMMRQEPRFLRPWKYVTLMTLFVCETFIPSTYEQELGELPFRYAGVSNGEVFFARNVTSGATLLAAAAVGLTYAHLRNRNPGIKPGKEDSVTLRRMYVASFIAAVLSAYRFRAAFTEGKNDVIYVTPPCTDWEFILRDCSNSLLILVIR